MSRAKKWLYGILIVVVVAIAGIFVYRATGVVRYVNSTTPTFFFHGWGSSYKAEQIMTNGAKWQGATNTIVWENVGKNGHVTFHGKIAKGARNPIIEVNFANNKIMSYRQEGRYTYDAVKAASQKWGFKKMNMVAHSMGNLGVVFYLYDHGQQKNLPTLEKQVAIAGHFNGGIGFGYPKGATVNAAGKPAKEERNFTTLKKLRKTYPTTVRVLNIYGDLKNGTYSDSQIPVNSAKTLKYLAQPRAKAYQEKEFTGYMAQHSRLHSNPLVIHTLVNFLWGK